MKMIPRFFSRFKVKYLIAGVVLLFFADYFGIFTHLFELNYERHFHWPLDGDVLKYAHQIRYNQAPEIAPLNIYNYTFLKDCSSKCFEEGGGTPVNPKLVFLVKSAMKNFNRRNAIRATWGYEKRFSDVIIRTVFLLGVGDNRELQKHIDIESDQKKDIVQADFVDAYYNNTIKTMIGFRWVGTFCPRSKFFMFVDDDFYVSAKNVLRFLRNPSNYPEYLEEADETLRKLARKLNQSDLPNNATKKSMMVKQAQNIMMQGFNSVDGKKHFHRIEDYVIGGSEKLSAGRRLYNRSRERRNAMDMEMPSDVKLFAGFVFRSSPHRHKSSKWHVKLSEYPFHLWPPYVTAGAFILSREAIIEMYYVSMYTRHFRFDDIYLALLAKKADIEPFHCEEFYFHKAIYTGPQSYRYVVASHGYDNADEMLRIWTQARAAGHS